MKAQVSPSLPTEDYESFLIRVRGILFIRVAIFVAIVGDSTDEAENREISQAAGPSESPPDLAGLLLRRLRGSIGIGSLELAGDRLLLNLREDSRGRGDGGFLRT